MAADFKPSRALVTAMATELGISKKQIETCYVENRAGMWRFDWNEWVALCAKAQRDRPELEPMHG